MNDDAEDKDVDYIPDENSEDPGTEEDNDEVVVPEDGKDED